jgi:hypothetical protein
MVGIKAEEAVARCIHSVVLTDHPDSAMKRRLVMTMLFSCGLAVEDVLPFMPTTGDMHALQEIEAMWRANQEWGLRDAHGYLIGYQGPR